MPNSFGRLALLLAPLAFALHSAAQPALTAADYARAEKFMGCNINPLVYHAVHPAWTPGELLWYRDTGADGARFVIFDPAKLTKGPAFDHDKLAAALSAAAAKKYEANKLPFNSIELSADGSAATARPASARRRKASGPSGFSGPMPLPRTRRRRPSSANTICGCAISPPARRRRSPPTA